MKKIIVLLLLCIASTSFAGEVLDLPFVVVVSEPVTDKVELQKMVITFEPTKLVTKVNLEYSIYNPNRTIPLVNYQINVTGSEIDTIFSTNTWNDMKEEIKADIAADIQSRLPVQPK